MFDSLSRSCVGVQHIAHLAREPVGRKWLLQEGAPGRQRAVLYDCVPRISRHVEHPNRSEEHTFELQSRQYLVCRLLLEKKKKEETPYRTQSQPRSQYEQFSGP